jgi:hypothetical protein
MAKVENLPERIGPTQSILAGFLARSKAISSNIEHFSTVTLALPNMKNCSMFFISTSSYELLNQEKNSKKSKPS